METNTESNSQLQNSDDIKEEVDSDDVEEILVGCDNISPKQCQKLQFSIAQIMVTSRDHKIRQMFFL